MKKTTLTPKNLARAVARLMLTKKAYDVTILDLRKITTMTDFFVICSADSNTQVKAVADAVMEGMEKQGINVWHNEGYMDLNWVLLDYVDVVCHVFHKDTRGFYNLERLWGDAVFEYAEDTGEGVLFRPREEKRTKSKSSSAGKKSPKAKEKEIEER
jgi:ribosome-associated protein